MTCASLNAKAARDEHLPDDPRKLRSRELVEKLLEGCDHGLLDERQPCPHEVQGERGGKLLAKRGDLASHAGVGGCRLLLSPRAPPRRG